MARWSSCQLSPKLKITFLHSSILIPPMFCWITLTIRSGKIKGQANTLVHKSFNPETVQQNKNTCTAVLQTAYYAGMKKSIYLLKSRQHRLCRFSFSFFSFFWNSHLMTVEWMCFFGYLTAVLNGQWGRQLCPAVCALI